MSTLACLSSPDIICKHVVNFCKVMQSCFHATFFVFRSRSPFILENDNLGVIIINIHAHYRWEFWTILSDVGLLFFWNYITSTFNIKTRVRFNLHWHITQKMRIDHETGKKIALLGTHHFLMTVIYTMVISFYTVNV